MPTTLPTLPVGADRLGYVAFWAQPRAVRERVFAELREQRTPHRFAIPKVPLTDSGGYAYALVTHEQVSEASRNAKVFSSEPNATSWSDPPRVVSWYFDSMINMDDPRHAEIRRIVSRAFTPRILEKMEGDLRRRASSIVDDIVRVGPHDFVPQVAARLPIQVICDMLTIPDKHYDKITLWTNRSLGYTDPEYNGLARTDDDLTTLDMARSIARFVRSGRGLFKIARQVGDERRREPGEDLTSRLVAAADGDNLSPRDFGSFFLLLVAAGNETTRNALAHAVHLFTQNPDQLELLLEDFEGRIAGAIEEVIRMATPVIQFRRTVTEDIEFHGRSLRRGDKVVLFYNSANRDAEVFEEPDRFDILRSPNKHVGFGGPGPHFCLGAHLARRELTVMLRELYTRLPGLCSTGQPDELRSFFLNGIKHMDFTYDAAQVRRTA